MTSTKYPTALQDALEDLFPDDPTIQAVGAGYTYSATDTVVDDLADLLGDPIALTSPDYTDGILTADTPTITGLSNADTIKAFIIYNDTGATSTSKLVRFIDTDANGVAINYVSDGSDLPVPFPGLAIVKLG